MKKVKLVVIVAILALMLLTVIVSKKYYANSEEKFFYSTLSKISNPTPTYIPLKEVINFQWDYVCGVYSYEIYDKNKLEEKIGFKFDGEIPKTYK